MECVRGIDGVSGRRYRWRLVPMGETPAAHPLQYLFHCFTSFFRFVHSFLSVMSGGDVGPWLFNRGSNVPRRFIWRSP